MKKDKIDNVKTYKNSDGEDDEEDTFPFAFCPKCKKKVPVIIDTFEKEANVGKDIISVDVVYCGQCETVLNFNKSLELDWLTKEEVEALGWEVTKVGR